MLKFVNWGLYHKEARQVFSFEFLINEFSFSNFAGTLSMDGPVRRLSKAIATDSKQVHLIASDVAVEMQKKNTKF